MTLKHTIISLILVLLLCFAGMGDTQDASVATGIGGYPNLLELNIPFTGSWKPGVEDVLLEPGDYSDISNMRYNNTGIEGVSGFSKINSSVVNATYLKIKNGFHFTKDEPAESHVLVQAYNTGLTASKIYENETAIPNTGAFTATELHTDASGASKGRFATAPNGTMVYCNNADRPQVWPGDEGKCMSFITTTAAVGNSLTNPRDYTERVQNTLQTSDEVATIGGGTAYSLLLHMDGADGGTTFTNSATSGTITAATIAFVDSNPDTITDAGSAFVTSGFVVGSITVSGSVGNDGTYAVDTVAAGTLTLAIGEALNAEGAGATVTITMHPVTAAGNAQTDTDQFIFPSASCLLDGTGDYLSIPDSAHWFMDSGNTTIDTQLRFNAFSNGVLRYIGHDDQGGVAKGVWGDGTYIFLANDSGGLESYSVNSLGALTYIDAETTPTTTLDVWGDGDFVYTACDDEGLHSNSVDGSGNLTHVDSDDQGDNAYGVWGDGSFIYLANGTGGLHSYSVDGSGTLTHIDSDDQGGTAYAAWGDGNYIYIANGNRGLESYSVDDSGNLTHVDAPLSPPVTDARYVWGDGTFIYVSSQGDGLHVYSVDESGNLTLVDTDDQGGTYTDVWGDGNYIYVCNETAGSSIRTYSVDGSGNLTYIDTDAQGGAGYYGVWGDGDYIYAGSSSYGITTYSLDSMVIFEQRVDDDNVARLYWEYNNYLTFSIRSAASEIVNVRGAWEPSANTDYHIALERGWQGGANTWALTVSGSDIATASDSSAWPNLAAAFTIGNAGSTGYCNFNGWLDELRVWKGTCAWADDFTPPSREYSSGSGYGMIGSPWKLDGVKFYVSSANTTSSTLTFEEWTGTAWSGLVESDGTSSGGKALAQTGWITWPSTESSSEPRLINGYNWYWYQYTLSAGSADVYYITVSAPVQDITNIWDGAYSQCAGAKIYEATNADYWDYTDEINSEVTSDVMPLDALEATNDYILLGFTERQQGLEISFVATEENSTAATTLAVYYWDGEAWQAVSGLYDGTSVGSISFARNGVITWAPPSQTDEFTKDIGGEDLFYYYKLVFDQNIDASCDVYYIQGIPATDDVLPYAFPLHFQNRTLLFNRSGEPSECLVSAENTSYIFNGDDSTTFNIGTDTALTAAASLSNSYDSSIDAVAVVCKDSETWALREAGDGGPNFIQHQLSKMVGCPAPLTMDACEIIPGLNVAIWVSYDGPVMCDGATITPIKGIEPYFDPIDSLFVGYSNLEAASGFIDPVLKEYNLIVGNNWLIYDFLRSTPDRPRWFKKAPSTYPECGFRVRDTDGGQYCYLGFDDGYMYRNENTNAFSGSDITQSVTLADIAPAGMWFESQIDFLKLVVKAKNTGTNETITVKHRADGATSWTTLTGVPMYETGSRYVQHTQRLNKQGITHQFYLQAATDDQTKGMEPLRMSVRYKPLRTDTSLD